MRLDFTMIPLDMGAGKMVFGSRYMTELKFKKSAWVENTYDKSIFCLTKDEQNYFELQVEKYITKKMI